MSEKLLNAPVQQKIGKMTNATNINVWVLLLIYASALPFIVLQLLSCKAMTLAHDVMYEIKW